MEDLDRLSTVIPVVIYVLAAVWGVCMFYLGREVWLIDDHTWEVFIVRTIGYALAPFVLYQIKRDEARARRKRLESWNKTP